MTPTSGWLRFWLGAALAGAAAGCASSPDTPPPSPSALPAAAPAGADQLARRDNAASLLYQLFEQEKNVKVLLYIKLESDEVDRLITEISSFTGEGAARLQAMAKTDPALDLQALNLPPGEEATRTSIAAAKRNQLLLSGGRNFEFKLLLAQVEALNYGRHLAQVAADNSSVPAQAEEFAALGRGLERLLNRALDLLLAAQP